MFSFKYYAPTEIEFGKDKEFQTGKLLKKYGAKNVLVHYGKSSVIKSGLLDNVVNSIQNENINYVKLGGVVPNPRLDIVNKGIDICLKNNIDFILAVGGGSVIDSAKAIALGVYDKGDIWDFFIKKRSPQGAISVATILTLPATGSEMSAATVITNNNGNYKYSTAHESLRPKFSILNPYLTLSLPKEQTFAGCCDIIMHTMERYFNGVKNNIELTDDIAKVVIQAVMKNAKVLFKTPNNIQARVNIMWAGSLSHCDLTGLGTDGGVWATHAIEHEVSALYDITHGVGLAAVWGSWARYVLDNCIDRFYKFATDIMEIKPTKSKTGTAILGIEKMESFFQSINLPIKLKDLNLQIDDVTIDSMADKCIHYGRRILGSAKILSKEDVICIYKMALK